MKNLISNNKLAVVAITIITTIANTSQASVEKMVAEMNSFQKPLADQLKKTLEIDPEFAKDYKIYVSQIKKVYAVQTRPEVLEKEILAINNQYEALFDKAMKKAKIDPVMIQKKAKSLSMKYSSKTKKYHLRPDKFLTYAAWEESLESYQPIETELEFTAPFAFEHSLEQGGIATVNLDTGLLSGNSHVGFLGHKKANAGVGQYVRIPWGNETVRVSAKLPEVDVYVYAIAGLGGSGAKASTFIDIRGENGVICSKKELLAEVVAPLIWSVSLSLTETTLAACETISPPANQDIVVRFQVQTEATAGGNAIGSSSMNATPDPIRVRLIQ